MNTGGQRHSLSSVHTADPGQVLLGKLHPGGESTPVRKKTF